MALPYKPPLEPMEAVSVAELPRGDDWQYEPKWDGFRCLAFRDGAEITLQSKSGQPLTRYFPELVAALGRLGARRFILDGEIVVPIRGRLSFDDLLQRIHPAASRVEKLSKHTPALLIVFDLLADERGRKLADKPLAERRQFLDVFAGKHLGDSESVRVSPMIPEFAAAQRWWKRVGADLDGLIAKRRDLPYRFGERDGMVKVKQRRTADCVVGGFRYATKGQQVGSLLLGLYDEDQKLHHVGFTSSIATKDKAALTAKLEKLTGGPGFTGRAPGGPSRWSTKRSAEWQPLKPRLVVEVEYDHVSGRRFRHGTRLVRWRPDKAPRQCTFEQLAQSLPSLSVLER